MGGRFQFALYHTIIFKDRYLVAPGGPVLDLLGGAPAGDAGGQYQHEIEAQMGYTDNGYGARLSADWRSATTVVGGAAGSTRHAGLLRRGDGQPAALGRLQPAAGADRRAIPALRGVRLTLQRHQPLQPEHPACATPPARRPSIYQSAYLDPTGRVISINLRKIFY